MVSASIGWPVRVRNTSSSVGRRRPMSSTAMLLLVEQAHDGGQLLGAAVDGRGDALGVAVGAGVLGADAVEDLGDGGEVVAGGAGAPR